MDTIVAEGVSGQEQCGCRDGFPDEDPRTQPPEQDYFESGADMESLRMEAAATGDYTALLAASVARAREGAVQREIATRFGISRGRVAAILGATGRVK